MKAFAIFPTISVFISTFCILREQFNVGINKNLIWSTLTTLVFGGLFLAGAKVFPELVWLLILINVAFGFLLIPILAFTIDSFFSLTTGLNRWLKLFGIGLVSIVITAGLLGGSLLFALMHNPMDPGPK